MSNIIDKIQVSGITYDIGGSGGGKAIEAGRGISVTTGETADTVSFNLSISAGTGTDSIQEGSNTIASGNCSHSEGSGTTASGDYSHSEGAKTSATTNYSHAEGNRTLASGTNSHAEGYFTKATGNYSHTEGQMTSAQTLDSHAEGYKTITKNNYEHAACRFNKSVSAVTQEFGDSGNTLFSIGNGNGNSEETRHNALEARQNGDIYIANTNDTSTSNFYEKPMVKLQDYLASPTEKSTWNAKSNFSGDYNDLTNKLSAGTNITIVDNVISATGGGGGNPTVELTQAEYDALVTAGTVSADTYYIITDAQAGDLTNYYTKSETNTLLGGKADTATTYTKTEVDNAITGATSTKQDTLVSGTNIKTINNESILGSGNIDIQGGGGKAIEAGRGIAITTGETADTVSFNLPISAGTGNNSIKCGGNCIATQTYSAAFGNNSSANGIYSFAINQSTANGQDSFSQGTSHAEKTSSAAFGQLNYSKNKYELSCGSYNNSVSATTTFGDSGNTLFSVGNGTDDNARHNAFEIRQNGDIYCSDGTNDVKLQDTITATAANTTALGGLSLVKLTQSAYDALSPNYDSNTLYVIVN